MNTDFDIAFPIAHISFNVLIALAVFGGIKGRFLGIPPLRGALQTVITGGLAAAAAFLIARLIS